MIQVERFLAGIIAGLPESSERKKLAGWLQEARDYNGSNKPEATS